MLKKVLFAIISIIIILTLAIWYVVGYKGILFHKIPWLIAAAVVLGLAAGTIRGIKHNIDGKRRDPQADRHTIDSFLEHWGTAAGIIILIISGFFLKVGYYEFLAKNLHFTGQIMTLFFGDYFLTHFVISQKYKYLVPGISDIIDGTLKQYLLRTVWEDKGKYLASQKSAFLLFAILGSGILVTGATKVAAYYFSVPFQLLQIVTQAHDIIAVIFVLLVLVHIIFALISHSHRRLLKSLFTGKN